MKKRTDDRRFLRISRGESELRVYDRNERIEKGGKRIFTVDYLRPLDDIIDG